MIKITLSTIQVLIQLEAAGSLCGARENLRHVAFYQASANWGICIAVQ
jgi:hypothetical protein